VQVSGGQQPSREAFCEGDDFPPGTAFSQESSGAMQNDTVKLWRRRSLLFLPVCSGSPFPKLTPD